MSTGKGKLYQIWIIRYSNMAIYFLDALGKIITTPLKRKYYTAYVRLVRNLN